MSEVANPALSQVVLIGVSDYRHLPNLMPVRNNVTGFAELLGDPAYWGFRRRTCTCCSTRPAPVR